MEIVQLIILFLVVLLMFFTTLLVYNLKEVKKAKEHNKNIVKCVGCGSTWIRPNPSIDANYTNDRRYGVMLNINSNLLYQWRSKTCPECEKKLKKNKTDSVEKESEAIEEKEINRVYYSYDYDENSTGMPY